MMAYIKRATLLCGLDGLEAQCIAGGLLLAQKEVQLYDSVIRWYLDGVSCSVLHICHVGVGLDCIQPPIGVSVGMMRMRDHS